MSLNEKTVKIRVKLPHVNKKPLLFREQKTTTLHAAKPLTFSLHFLFRRDQNHNSKLTSKIMKMCEQILKKTIAGRIPKRLEVKIHLNGIQLLIRQNVPPLI